MKKIGFIALIIFIASFKVNSQNENTLSQVDKLYGLSKLWKEVSYNFAFFEQVPNLNWDSCYQSFIPKVLETKTDWEYFQVLQQFFVPLKDGHTRVFPPGELRNKYYGTATKQIQTQLIDGKVIITKIISKSDELKDLKPGMEIVMIDNMDVHAYAEKYVAPYIYASTPHDRTLQIYRHFLLSGSVSVPALVKVKDFKGKIKEFKIHREPWLIEQEIFEKESLEFKVLPNNIGYLKVNNLVGNDFWDKFNAMYSKILETDGLIIDNRDNVGGSTQLSNYILRYLTNEKFQTVKWLTPLHNAALHSWGKNPEWFVQEPEYVYPHEGKTIYTKPINMLIDASTFSGGEDFCFGFIMMKRGKLIGSTTAGSTGNPYLFDLPGSGLGMICTKKDVFPDGIEYVGYGFEPDIKVDITIEDIKNGNDEALNVAIRDMINK